MAWAGMPNVIPFSHQINVALAGEHEHGENQRLELLEWQMKYIAACKKK
jgi:hypothetical protein